MSLEQIPMTYHASRRRKTFGLQVKPMQVKVFYPFQASISEVEHWVKSQSLWIEKHWLKLKHTANLPSLDVLPPNMWWQGEQLAMEALVEKLGFNNEFFELPVHHQKNMLLQELQSTADQILPSFVIEAVERLGRGHLELKIRPYKSRWGSCDAKRRITMNTLLVMAPDAVAHYVACHEAAHLFHLNHSRAFWQTVQKLCTKAHIASAKAWLNVHGRELTFLLR